VRIKGGDLNQVGDHIEVNPRNTIAYNDADGVTVETGSANAVLRNSIHDNGDLGIDLRDDGPTANDPLDADAGPNGLQNGPEIASATATTVDWTLESQPQTLYRLEFYACDRPGAGEGETYLGSTLASTDANGNAGGSTLTATPAGVGADVTMTATRETLGGLFPNLVVGFRSTSEFSPCEAVV
jgi:hypothetical protein